MLECTCSQSDFPKTVGINILLHGGTDPNHRAVGLTSIRELDSLDCRQSIFGPILMLLLLLLLFLGSLLRRFLDPLLLFFLRTCKLREIAVLADENKTRVDNAEACH